MPASSTPECRPNVESPPPLCSPGRMGQESDSAGLWALVAELERKGRDEVFRADLLGRSASDHDRWGLGGDAAALRRRARHHRVNGLLYQSQAACWRAQRPSTG